MEAAHSQNVRHLHTKLHGVTSKKITIFIFTAVQTPNLTIYEKYISIRQQQNKIKLLQYPFSRFHLLATKVWVQETLSEYAIYHRDA
jgi:hypothetical protein